MLPLHELLAHGDIVEVVDTWVGRRYPGNMLASSAFTQVGTGHTARLIMRPAPERQSTCDPRPAPRPPARFLCACLSSLPFTAPLRLPFTAPLRLPSAGHPRGPAARDRRSAAAAASSGG